MSLGVRVAVAIVTLIAVMLLASCSGDGGRSLRATLTDDGCMYEGDTSPDAGTFTIETWHEQFGLQTQTVTVDGTAPGTAAFSYKAS